MADNQTARIYDRMRAISVATAKREGRELAETLHKVVDLITTTRNQGSTMPTGVSLPTDTVTRVSDRFSEIIEINRVIVSSVTAIVVADTGEIIGATEPADMMFGYAIGELAGRRTSVHELVPPELRQKHIEHWEAFWKHPRARQMGTARMTLEGYHVDGTRFPIEVGWGHPVFVLGYRAVVASIMHIPHRETQANNTLGS